MANNKAYLNSPNLLLEFARLERDVNIFNPMFYLYSSVFYHRYFLISESNVDNLNTTVKQWKEVVWGMKDFMFDPMYVILYNNLARNFITAIIPLVSLGCLHYLVYKHLTRRRKMVSRLGLY